MKEKNLKKENGSGNAFTITKSITLKLTLITQKNAFPPPLHLSVIFHSNQLEMLKGFYAHSRQKVRLYPLEGSG